jgi:hypothetical protein
MSGSFGAGGAWNCAVFLAVLYSDCMGRLSLNAARFEQRSPSRAHVADRHADAEKDLLRPYLLQPLECVVRVLL